MLKIRLRRMGNRNRAFYRVVVSDSRKVPTSSVVEELGHYNPVKKPVALELDRDRVQYWVDRGAQMSPTVKNLVDRV